MYMCILSITIFIFINIYYLGGYDDVESLSLAEVNLKNFYIISKL